MITYAEKQGEAERNRTRRGGCVLPAKPAGEVYMDWISRADGVRNIYPSRTGALKDQILTALLHVHHGSRRSD